MCVPRRLLFRPFRTLRVTSMGNFRENRFSPFPPPVLVKHNNIITVDNAFNYYHYHCTNDQAPAIDT